MPLCVEALAIELGAPRGEFRFSNRYSLLKAIHLCVQARAMYRGLATPWVVTQRLAARCTGCSLSWRTKRERR